MPGSIVAELADMFADTMGWRAWLSEDVMGDPTYEEDTTNLAVKLSGRIRIVRDTSGQEHVSTVQATIAGVYGVKVADEFTLPADYDPRQPTAIAVKPVRDENGPHHEVVFFR